jgi:hypothetical protein
MTWWKIGKTALKCAALIVFALLPVSSWSQTCHVVTPSGSGAKNGSDWNNAYAGLPSKLVRGDSYYLADGAYPNYTFNTDPMPWRSGSNFSAGSKVHPWTPNGHVYQAENSGTTGTYDSRSPSYAEPTWCTTAGCTTKDGGITWKEVKSSNPATISIKKATPADHCTDTGWNASTMGSGQAIFHLLTLSSDFVTLDGQTRTSLNSGYGIYVDMSCASGKCYGLYMGNPYYTSSYYNIRYVGVSGNGYSVTDTIQDDCVYLARADYVTMSYMYVTQCSMAPYIVNGYGKHIVLEYSYITENGSTPTNHGGTWQDVGGGSDKTFRYNLIENPTGTAVFAFIPVGSVGTISDYYVYGNVVYSTGQGAVGDGLFASFSPNQTNNNIKIFNNTIVGFNKCCDAGIKLGDTDNGDTAYNNIWYNNTVPVSLSGLNDEDYNTFLNGGSGKGSHDVNIATGATSPFVNAGGPTYDFHLTGENSNLTGGFNTSSILPGNTTDPDGLTRGADGTWERGAYEYAAGASTKPSPPQLSVTSVH